MPKIIIDDAKGLYQTAGKGVVGLTQSKTVNSSFVAASTKIKSGAVVIPANSLITAIHAVITTTLTSGSNNAPTLRVGTTDDAVDIVAATAITTDLAAATSGKGVSTTAAVRVSLNGANTLTIVAGQAYRVSETNLYLNVTGGAALTAGAVQFTVEFITFE
jgi:hypothetical protein